MKKNMNFTISTLNNFQLQIVQKVQVNWNRTTIFKNLRIN